jgi:hypothetical protein
MTQRDRQASGGVFGTALAAPLGQPASNAATGPGLAAPPASLWEELFCNASPAQQQELLALAGQQGVLYAHQLPPPPNGSTGDRPRHLLNRLLAGQYRDLEPVRAAPIVATDPDLDESQRDAVAKALATLDVCLIQGLPGTGKTRVVVEIVAQAAARGERILLVAGTPAPVDRVLELVADRPGTCPVRCLGRDEALERLPVPVRALTLLERLHRLRDQSLPRARAEVTASEERCRRLHQDEAQWPGLRELAGQQQGLAERRAALDAARAGVAADVERAAATVEAAGQDEGGGAVFADALRAALRRRDETLARVADDLAKTQARLTEADQEQHGLREQFDGLAPLVEARKQGHWWSGVWWRSRLSGDVLARATELEACLQRVGTDLEALEQQQRGLLAEQEREQEQYAAERARLLDADCRRRHDKLDAREAAWRQDEQLLQGKWQAACRQLQPETPAPAAACTTAVEAARAAWQEARRREEERTAFARQWAACLEEAADTFTQRLPALCNLVAGTTTALPADPYFGDAATPRVGFDLLILEDADQVTEAEFLAMARRARRWVLVGQPAFATPAEATPAKAVRSTVLKPGLFQRLWQQLYCDPGRLPYAWVQETTGLCCQLRPLTAEQSQWLESEPLSDSPDIELRILAVPRSAPQLAEVIFPASMAVPQAKEYIFRELEELPVHAAGRSLRWVEDNERVVLSLGDGVAPGAVPVCLEPGVRELLHPEPAASDGRASRPASWRTCSVEFERGAGWHRQRAEEWVERHLGLRDMGRTARLDVPYRMQRDLALFLSDLLFEGEYRLPDRRSLAGASGLCPAVEEPGSAVEFVPVPPLQDNVRQGAGAMLSGQRSAHGRGRTAEAVHTAQPRRGGAGLELDLADVRHRDRLPSEFRAALPDAGLVNYLEAQAVVHTLEALAADPAVRAARPSVGVIALYAGQAALIRRLLQQSPAAAALDVTVDVPAGFRERESAIVLLSLTRSHSHRAVSFGDGPPALALALTRARTKLYVFGDVGTLARRSQWHNPLDHLDEAASAREWVIVSALLAYVQGKGRHAPLFQLHEGSQA